jgi:hypothetical protein
MQTRVRAGWNVTMAAVLSTLLAGGCGGTADSGRYEVILDQPEPPASDLSSESVVEPATAQTSTDTANATSTEPETVTIAGTPAPDSVAPSTVVLTGGTTSDETPTPVDVAVAQNTPGSKDSKDYGKPATATGTEPKSAEDTTPPAAQGSVKAQPRVVTLLIPDKKFKSEGSENALRVSFDDFDLLKVLNMDPVTEDAPSRMPKWLKDLDGKQIRVRGFMFPPFEDTNIRGFTLARDNQICCFGRNPLVYDLVDVFMRKGESTDYIQNRPFDVIGVFHIGDSIIPGELYSMDDAVVVDQ